MAFEWIGSGEGEHLRSTLLTAAGAAHAFGSRRGGVSSGRYESANRGFFSDDEEDHVHENWRRLLVAGGLAGTTLHYLRQVHGAMVVDVTREVFECGRGAVRWLGMADGLASSLPGVSLAITTADCVPVLMAFDPPQTGGPAPVAALHCGWRSAVARILPGFLARLGRSPRAVALGPHIRRCHFEVGADVAAELSAAAPVAARATAVEEAPDRKARGDLEALLLAQLAAAGVERARVDAGAPCTYCEPERFFSFRRDGPGGGLLGHVIGAGALQSGAVGGPG